MLSEPVTAIAGVSSVWLQSDSLPLAVCCSLFFLCPLANNLRVLCDIYCGKKSQGDLLVDSSVETGIDSWMLQYCLCPSEGNPGWTIYTPVTEDRALGPWQQVALLSCGDRLLHSRQEGKNCCKSNAQTKRLIFWASDCSSALWCSFMRRAKAWKRWCNFKLWSKTECLQ